jgi:hypothetical protein
LITKVVFTVAITLGTGLAVATQAGADPSSFGTLSCNCAQPIDVPHGKPAVKDQVSRGIRSGRGSLPGRSPDIGGQVRQ